MIECLHDYKAVGRAICTLGNQQKPTYWPKPSAKAEKVQRQLEKHPSVKVVEIEDALSEAAEDQRNLATADTKLVSVNAPDWLHIKEMAPKVIAPKPKFVKL